MISLKYKRLSAPTWRKLEKLAKANARAIVFVHGPHVTVRVVGRLHWTEAGRLALWTNDPDDASVTFARDCPIAVTWPDHPGPSVDVRLDVWAEALIPAVAP